jgi:hypothetical protein
MSPTRRSILKTLAAASTAEHYFGRDEEPGAACRRLLLKDSARGCHEHLSGVGTRTSVLA